MNKRQAKKNLATITAAAEAARALEDHLATLYDENPMDDLGERLGDVHRLVRALETHQEDAEVDARRGGRRATVVDNVLDTPAY